MKKLILGTLGLALVTAMAVIPAAAQNRDRNDTRQSYSRRNDRDDRDNRQRRDVDDQENRQRNSYSNYGYTYGYNNSYNNGEYQGRTTWSNRRDRDDHQDRNRSHRN